MTDLDEMIAFTRAQILADRAAATATLDTKDRIALQRGLPIPRWRFVSDGEIRDTDNGLRVKFTWPYEAEHIRRHDPANVIADCDAKLGILDEHKPTPVDPVAWRDDQTAPFGCITCHFSSEEGVQGVGLCPTVRLLAQGYRHRDGFKAEWSA